MTSKKGKVKIMEIFAHFRFSDGSNPYITTSYSALWGMIKKYDIEFFKGSIDNFEVFGKKQILSARPLSKRDKEKFILKDFAFEWQRAIQDASPSLDTIISWQRFFEKYGKKYGCLREFKENALV